MRSGFLVGAMLALFSAPMAHAEEAAPQCELHVWGAGYPIEAYSERLRRQQDPFQIDLTQPLSNASLLNPANRAMALSDDLLLKLLPGAVIIRHPRMFDRRTFKLKQIKGPLSGSPATCQADLLVWNTAMYTAPTPDQIRDRQIGSVGQLIIGGSRFVIDFWMQRRKSAGETMQVYQRRNDCPLEAASPNSPAMRDALIKASDCILASYVETVAKRGN